MNRFISARLSRILRLLLPAILLTGCFGEGDGPERILGTPAPPPPPIPPGFCDDINFEDVCTAPGIANFAGGATTIIDNPDQSGLNTSDKVAQMQKFADQPFGGTTITPNMPVDFSGGEVYTMNVWSPRGVPVLFKFEGLDRERSVSHTGSGTWEQLCFDFTADTMGNPVTGITIIFDLGVNGEAATDPNNWTFFYDDIAQVASCPSGGGPTTFGTITFDDPAVSYTLTGFGGAEDSQVVADPTGGMNQVVQVNRAAGAEVFAGTVVSTGSNLSIPTIPLDAANTQMTVRVYSPAAGVPVRLKIENAAQSAISVETEALTTVANMWETLTFDFANEVGGTPAFDPAATYNKVTIFFNFGAAGAPAQTYFFDDIDVGSGGGGGPGTFGAITFDDPAITYTLRGFGGAEDSTVVGDPTGGANQVVQVNRSAVAETFAGTVVSTGANESIPAIPLDAANTQMNVRVYSPAAGIPVRLKVENSNDPAVSVETEATTTVANAWETLTFDFANEASGTAAFDPAATYDKVILFFNFGTDGATAGAQTFFFDDIDVGAGSGGGGGGFGAITFDDPAVTYTLRGFGGAEDSTLIPDPTDGSNTVVQVNRSAAAETFAGTVVSTGPNESIPVIPLDAANTTMTVAVFSPAAGIPVRLKVENSNDPAVSVETEATTTAAGVWETLTFDFANEVSGTAAFNPAATYDKVVIFFNFGTDGATAGAQTFLFDDIDVGAGGGGGGGGFAPVDFDDPAVTYTLRGFGGAEDSTVIADPTDGSNMVVQVNRSAAAETFAGTVVSTGPNESIPVIPLDAANTTMNVRVFSPAAGIPVRLKIENSNDPAVSVETEATTTAANTWEELTFDFANEVSGTAAFNPAATYDKVVIFFNFGTDGATAGAQTFLFDDIDVGPGAGGGGGGGSFAPVDFDDPAVTYTLRGFGGAEDSTLITDPTDGSNTVVQVNRSAAAETFAGTVVSTGPNESIPVIPLDAANTTMNVRVFSPAAGIPVRLKIENSNDPAVSVETEATTTVANTWEDLTFDFANEVSGTAAFNPASTYDKVVIFFNFGTDGATAGAQTFLFDDIDVGPGAGGGGGGGGGTALLDFDDPAVTYTFIGFGGGEDAAIEADPDDASNNVGRVNRSAAAETFAGTIVATLPNEAIPVIPLDASNTQVTVRVRSPLAGIQVRVKVENSNDPGQSVETEATTTVADAWETLTFDFANEAAGTAAFNPAFTYDKFVIFFNFGVAGSGAVETYYFDDVELGAGSGGGGGGSSSVDFESGSATFNDFGGGVAAVISNPDPSGLNTSGLVGQMQKFAGETFGGSTLDLGGSVALAAGDSYTMLVRAQRAVPVTFKLEPQGDERVANYSGSGAWELLCFDFTGVAGDVTGITIIFDNGVPGDAGNADPAIADDWIFQFDDIEQVSSCPGGGGGGATFDPITFDDPAVTYALRGFGGAEDSTLIQDPTDPANNVVQVNRSAAAETFAGTVVSTGPNESIAVIPLDAANTTMNVRVYSPAAGIPVRLKIENSNDPAVSVETEATTTVANAWEELTFDFANEVSGTAAFNPAATYDKVVIFFNFGTTGATAGAQTFLFDDIDDGPGAGGGGGGGASFDPITFDDPAITYTLRGFGGAEDSTVVADPTDPANNVVQVVRSAAAETFAGTVFSTGPNESIPVIPLDAANTRMSVRVFSPAAGIPVRFKIENSNDPAVSVETETLTTQASVFETLTFDFANEVGGTSAFDPAATYDKAVIFFNFGAPGASVGEQTYFFDDIDFVGGGGTGGGGGGGGSSNFVNGDFENGLTGWTVTLIPDNTGSVTLDASGQGGRAGTVARLIASGSDVAGPNDVLLSQVAIGAGTIQAGDTIEVFFDLFGSLSGAGGVVFVEVIFLDAAGNDVGGRDFVGPAAPYTPTTAWTTHSGSVTAGTATGGGQFDVSGGVTLQLKAACGAIVGGCGVDASIDNVTFTIN